MRAIATLVAFVCLASRSALTGDTSASKSFETLKALAGRWHGTDKVGHAASITFRVLSGGTAVAMELVVLNKEHPDQSEDMLTVFHLDGDRLFLTHYCSAGNQPRMRGTVSPDGRTLTFEFVDATNLPDVEAGHMERLVIRLLSVNRHVEEWTNRDHGLANTNVFELTRVTR